jgi:hypothetical protein
MNARHGFFVGWSGRLPPEQRVFVLSVVASALVGFAGMALALSATIDDPGGGAAYWEQEVKVEGVLTVRPYPLLHLNSGHTLMLSGLGKSGVDADPALDGAAVTASGFMLKRGALDMLQSSAAEVLASGSAASPVPAAVSLGRWRLTGEICDGKCYAGSMRPGAGLAHKACASFCVLGGVPPVFVATAPIGGSAFMLIAGDGGAPMAEGLRELIGVRIALDGDVERVGDLVVFHADPTTARLP